MKPVVYQILTRLFGNRSDARIKHGTIAENGCGKMNDITSSVLRRIKQLGVTHVWYTGIIRHASTTDYSDYGIPCQHHSVVKGRAGSPYAITDYYDVDPDLAVDVNRRQDEFHELIARTHSAGLKLIIDFVPNHVAREYKSICKPSDIPDLGENDDENCRFSQENNFYYFPNEPFEPQFDLNRYSEFPAKATGNDCFTPHPSVNDWYETVKLNYGIDYFKSESLHKTFSFIPPTWKRMLEILYFWASKGIDGFRCDMAEMVPLAFWQWAISELKKIYPHIIIIGEVYQPHLYHNFISAGFDWLYDKVGMYDALRGIVEGHRHTEDITRQWQAVDDIAEHMLFFLENHDEQRIASDFFATDGIKAIPALMTMAMMRTNPIMIYAGQEYGERGMDIEGFSGLDGRTTIFDYWSLASLQHGYYNRRKLTTAEKNLEKKYKTILQLCNTSQAICRGRFFDLMYVNRHISDYIYSFIRKEDAETILVVANFSQAERHISLFVPSHAFDYLNLSSGVCSAIDALSGKSQVITLNPNESIDLDVPACCGLVLSLDKQH